MNSSIDELLAVDAAAAGPLYRQLYARLRGAIADGALRPGAYGLRRATMKMRGNFNSRRPSACGG